MEIINSQSATYFLWSSNKDTCWDHSASVNELELNHGRLSGDFCQSSKNLKSVQNRLSHFAFVLGLTPQQTVFCIFFLSKLINYFIKLEKPPKSVSKAIWQISFLSKTKRADSTNRHFCLIMVPHCKQKNIWVKSMCSVGRESGGN